MHCDSVFVTFVSVLLFAATACSAPAPPASTGTAAPPPGGAATPAAAAPTTAAANPTTAPAATGASNQNLIIAIAQSDGRTLDPAREFAFSAAFIQRNAYDTLGTTRGPNR